MKYTTHSLIEAINNNTKIKYVHFWGHTPKVPGVIDTACLSQWWPSPFAIDGITYKTVEHWMMAGKARLFNDEQSLTKIIAAEKPGQAKAFGRAVKNFDQDEWMNHGFDLVVAGNIAKFSQDEALNTFLLNTGNKILVEASPVDVVWGIGLAMDHRDSHNPEKWRGKNLLGFALMEARDYLRNGK